MPKPGTAEDRRKAGAGHRGRTTAPRGKPTFLAIRADGGKETFAICTRAASGVTVDREVASVKKSTSAIPALATGVFHHLVVTYDGSYVALFVDGALLASFADTRPSFATNPGLTIGAFWAPDPVSVIGAVDEVALYDKALSAA